MEHSSIKVCTDEAAMARAAAEIIVAAASAAVAVRGWCVMALSGGSTPRETFTLLAQPPYCDRVEWARVHLCWADERCVAPDSQESNYRLARETLLEHVPIPPDNVHRVRGELPPARAAEAYEETLRALFDGRHGVLTAEGYPRFDLIQLGMGNDGHTASLFPHNTALHERERWAIAVHAPVEPAHRVTLTLPVLNATMTALFLVTGEKKAARLHEVVQGAPSASPLPAQLVNPREGRIRWLVDAAAGSALREAA